jgi:uncharacterized protein YlxW (UPF0749 family)
MHAMKKDEGLILFIQFVGVFLLCILFLVALWRQCLQLLHRRRRLRQENNADEDVVLLEDISQLETNRTNQRSSRDLKEEVKSLRETQVHVRSLLQSLQTKLEEKEATSKALHGSRDKLE